MDSLNSLPIKLPQLCKMSELKETLQNLPRFPIAFSHPLQGQSLGPFTVQELNLPADTALLTSGAQQAIAPQIIAPPVEPLSFELQKSLSDLCRELSRHDYFFEKGKLIAAIHLYIDRLFCDAVKHEHFTELKALELLLPIHRISCLIGGAAKGGFGEVCKFLKGYQNLCGVIAVVQRIISKIANSNNLSRLSAASRKKIVSKRQGSLSTLLQTLQLVQDLICTESGVRALSQSCDSLITAGKRNLFNLENLFQGIRHRCQAIIGSLHPDILQKILPNLLSAPEQQLANDFCCDFSQRLQRWEQDFNSCITAPLSVQIMCKTMIEYNQLGLRIVNSPHRELLTGILDVGHISWGLDTCLALACDGVRAKLGNRMSIDQINELQLCLFRCQAMGDLYESLDWSRLELLLEGVRGDERVPYQKLKLMIASLKQVAQLYQQRLRTLKDASYMEKIELLRETREAPDPRDVYVCRDMFDGFFEMSMKAAAIVDIGEMGLVLLELQGLAEQSELNEHRNLSLVTVLTFNIVLRGILGNTNEISSVCSMLGSILNKDILSEPVVETQVQKPKKRNKKKKKKVSSQSRIQITEVKEKLSPALIKEEKSLPNTQFVDEHQDGKFATEEDLLSFIGNILVYTEEDPVAALVENSVAPMEEDSITIVETPPNTPIVTKKTSKKAAIISPPPVKETKKEPKERIDYSGRARSVRNVMKTLASYNFHLVRQKGSHAQMENADTKEVITIPIHGNKPICRKAQGELQKRLAELQG